LDSPFDLVTDGPDAVDALARGVVELPVLVTFAWVERAGVTAPHGDDDIGLPHGLVAEHFRRVAGDVDAVLGHRLHGDWVDLVRGLGPGGEDSHLIAAEMRQVARRHLRT